MAGTRPETSRTPADPIDLLDLDALLTGEERMIRDTVRGFVKDRVLPVIDEWFEAGHFDKGVIKELGALGLLGMHLKGYGCAGTNAVSYGITCLEMEAGDSGFRSAVSVQGSLSMWPIWRYGTDEQKDRWLPPMAAGELIGCFGLTEPDFGATRAACARTLAGTAATGSCPARRCGSRTEASPTWPWCGRRRTRGSAASSSLARRRDSRRETSNASSRCGLRSPRSWCSTSAGFRPTRCSPGPAASGVPSRRSMRRGSGSSGASWA